MSTCKLIHEEIQRISGLLVENLDPREYDNLMARLTSDIKKLSCFKNILDSRTINTFERWIKQKNIDIFDESLYNLVATSPEEISERSIIYVGDLDYVRYEKLNENVTKLPKSLKIILGKLYAKRSNIKSIDLEFVKETIEVSGCSNLGYVRLVEGGAGFRLNHCQNVVQVDVTNISFLEILECESLTTVSIERVHKGGISHSPNLINLTIGTVTSDIELSKNEKLTLSHIHSAQVGKKIKVGGYLEIDFFESAKPTETEILKKFDVEPKNIIRN